MSSICIYDRYNTYMSELGRYVQCMECAPGGANEFCRIDLRMDIGVLAFR